MVIYWRGCTVPRALKLASEQPVNGSWAAFVYFEAFTHSLLNATRVPILIPEGDRLKARTRPQIRPRASITTPAPMRFPLSPIESKPFCWPRRLFSTGQACEWSSAKGARGARRQLSAHFKNPQGRNCGPALWLQRRYCLAVSEAE